MNRRSAVVAALLGVVALACAAFPVAAGASGAAFAPSDFNGDARADLVWHNAGTGDVNVWLMNGLTLLPGSRTIGNAAPPDWHVFAVADFDGDGVSDVLLGNRATGSIVVWLMNGAGTRRVVGEVAQLDLGIWQFQGVGDLNGDARSDIVWRNLITGDVYVWMMNGLTIDPEGSGPIGSAPLAWTIAGIGDFDGDGCSDLLWRNGDTGENAVWFMKGAFVNDVGVLSTLDPSLWRVAGVGDLDGDLMSDIVWRNTLTGDVYVWLMEGLTRKPTSGFAGGAAPGVWTLIGVADIDGDFRADLIWRDTSQRINAWLMSGASIRPGSGTIGGVGSSQWRLVPP